MFNIIQKRKIWFIVSATAIVLSIIAFSVWGLNLGIDFTGGSLLELSFSQNRPTNQQIEAALADLKLTDLTIQPEGEQALLIRTNALTEEQHQQLLKKLNTLVNPKAEIAEPVNQNLQITTADGQPVDLNGFKIETQPQSGTAGNKDAASTNTNGQSVTELRFDSIGPVIGQELKQKAIYAIIIVLLAIIAYIAYAFRKVSYPVPSWVYGVAAVIALFHDITIVPGVFAWLGHYAGIQVDSYFVTALLTLLGFSVHDTIVTFDRIRENLKRHQDKTFENVINQSVNETIVRSINTSLTTIFVMLAIFLFGGETVKYFALALILGIFVGTYSSIFIASPLLMVYYKYKLKKAS